MGCQLWSKLCCLPLAERRLVLSGYPPGAPTFQERGFEQHASNNTAQSTTAWLATTRNAIALYMGPQYCLKADLESATLDIDGLRTGLSVVPMPKPLQCGYTRLGSDLDMHFENWHSLDYIPKARNKFTVIITSIHLRRSLYQMNWYSRMHSFIAKIILVWNGREPFPEDALESVKVICTQVFWERDNSLTNRYRHYDAVPTRFVFLTDDDLVLEEKAFSTAYKALLDSPTRIAGLFPRSLVHQPDSNSWRYVTDKTLGKMPPDGGGHLKRQALTTGAANFLHTMFLDRSCDGFKRVKSVLHG
ncbi:hypothetical protein CYMTET_49737 [Cymbomonas tetramitiformis]|uniref:Glycosyl transferase 64 domain-containing protein n=1 Tax=Cymbomonas tetramitiformis TaxID=36881 RepID=A0AAE0BPK0_9CHLO|nr:hypothetical protein CYMTET_49737 [Cymbomonas tetramitiformis]